MWLSYFIYSVIQFLHLIFFYKYKNKLCHKIHLDKIHEVIFYLFFGMEKNLKGNVRGHLTARCDTIHYNPAIFTCYNTTLLTVVRLHLAIEYDLTSHHIKNTRYHLFMTCICMHFCYQANSPSENCTSKMEEVKPCYSHRKHVMYTTFDVKIYTTSKLTLQNIVFKRARERSYSLLAVLEYNNSIVA